MNYITLRFNKNKLTWLQGTFKACNEFYEEYEITNIYLNYKTFKN